MIGKIKWGILGCARIAKEHFIPGLLKTSNSEFYAAASRDGGKIDELRHSFQFQKGYASYEELLDDKDIDAVYIPLPNGMHKEWTVKAAEKGKHVLCEKPICLNSGEYLEMLDACEKHGVKLMEAFMYRYTDKMKKVQEILRSEVIGEVKHVVSNFGFYQTREDDYRLDPDNGGGALYDVGSYTINFIGMVTQDTPESVTSELIKQNGIDVAASAIFKYKSGIMCTFNCWFNAFIRRYSEIIGTKGCIRLPQTFMSEENIFVMTRDGEEEIVTENTDRYQAEIEDFADAIINNRQPMIGADETLRNLRIMEQILGIESQT